MNIRKMILLSFFFIATIFTARAGVEVGNGGQGVLCDKSLELFDIYEGRVLNNNIPLEKEISFHDQALSFANHLSEMTDGDEDFDQKIRDVLNSLKFLPSGVGLSLTDDVKNFIYPKNCFMVQVLNYKDDGYIYVDIDYWNMFTETQKAAAILHETVYKYFREPDYLLEKPGDGDQDSVRARRLVSHLISGKELAPIHNKKLRHETKTQWLCKNSTDSINGSTLFIAYDNPDKVTIEFVLLNGRRMLSNASVVMQPDFNKVNERKKIDSIIDGDVTVEINKIGKPSENKFLLSVITGNNYIRQNITCTK
ncbi:MAG: hypothetical protein ACXVLQ_01325 [Bacteriovorax sp.]